MKKFYILTIALVLFSFSFASPVNTAIVNNGKWISNSTWSLGRQPINGDTLVIPQNMTVLVEHDVNMATSQLYMKVYGTLNFRNSVMSLNSNSKIILFGGATINNLDGNNTESIIIGGVYKYRGTEGTVTGVKYADNTTGSSPNSFMPFSPLPVKFIGFNVARQNNNILVEWTTAEEMNSSYYEVQRSENGNDWNTIANITAAGTTSLTHSYSHVDRNVTAKVVYYRIRQVDIDGKFAITPVRMIRNENNNTEIKLTVASSNSIYVHFSEQVKTRTVIRLTTSNGQVVSQTIFDSPIGQVLVPVQNSNKGIYIVTVTDGQDLKFSKQVLL